ncbi:isocitrate lyase/PEP mutase family protein [Roseiarcaceae bacterium H3SJ34-1]|uniref:isocitrate lyase/PEP mutase family protein n=1 Tax=Terripilifer ovatus TaxID=3032367 RepID=UPI003AB9461D|nr:isocitrate lyase/PEP mutase family protein [Roseiarcaceae bacterium H3SJ34-1]
MTATSRRQRLRALLASDQCYFPGSVFDAISARIAQEIGFETGMYAGSVASLAVLGAPDIILLTLSEFAEQARRIGRASDLPVIADADHGYGNALNVMRSVEELEHAGLAALTIEDTLLPRPFDQKAVTAVSLREGIGKMKAAVAARSDPSLCVIARTGALLMGGLSDALERFRAYQDTGVDGVFLTGVTSMSEIDAFAAVARLPILLGGTPAGLLNRKELASRGVRIALQGHQPFMAAVAAVRKTMLAQRNGTELPELVAKPDLDRLSGEPVWSARVRAFLTDTD